MLTSQQPRAHLARMAEGNLKMSYGQVETLIASILRVHDDRLSSLGARFALLRRLSFPPGVNVKRGRFSYDREALMKTVVVFALMDASVLPTQAVALVNAEWHRIDREIDRVLAQADLDDSRSQQSDRPSDAKFLVITVRARGRWTEPGTPDRDEGVRPDLLGEMKLLTEFELGKLFSGSVEGPLPPAHIVVDLHTVIDWAARAVVRAGWATRGQLLDRVR